MSSHKIEHQHLVFVVLLVAVVSIVGYYIWYPSERFSIFPDKTNKSAPVLQAVRWKLPTSNQLKGGKWVKENSQDSVSVFNKQNPFVGRIHNGLEIDGSLTDE